MQCLLRNFEELEQVPPDQVTGKVVLFNYPFDEFAARAGRWQQAYRSAVRYRNEGPAEAAASVHWRRWFARLALAGSVSLTPEPRAIRTGVPQIPVAAVPAEDAERLAGLANHGQVVVHLVLTPRDLGLAQSYNVIADLKGSQFPEQVVMVSGHLDSWDLGTGALDDAAGVAVARDVLRILKNIHPHPKRTIRFVAWMNEENGGAGGRAYAESHRSELRDHIAAIEIDYGDGRPLGLSVSATDSRLAPIAATLEAIANPIGGVVRVSDSPGADLKAINQAGVPAIAPVQDGRYYFAYHHTAADTFDKVRIEEVRRVVEVVTYLVYALADHD